MDYYKRDRYSIEHRELSDVLEELSVSQEDVAVSKQLVSIMDKLLKTLSPREERVLRMRFGIAEESDCTLEEVGQDFSLSKDRIRQIEAKALRKLRHPSRVKRLKDFVEI